MQHTGLKVLQVGPPSLIKMRCADALVRLLHLNAPASSLKSGGDDEAYKVLVLDRVTKDIVAPLLRINDLRKCVPCLNRLVLDAVLCMQDWLCSVVPRGWTKSLCTAPRHGRTVVIAATGSVPRLNCSWRSVTPHTAKSLALLRRHGVTLHLMLEAERQSIPDVPAVYFVRGVEEAVERAVADAAAGLYDSLHLNFTPSLPAPLMQKLAAGAWWQPVSSVPPEVISG